MYVHNMQTRMYGVITRDGTHLVWSAKLAVPVKKLQGTGRVASLPGTEWHSEAATAAKNGSPRMPVGGRVGVV